MDIDFIRKKAEAATPGPWWATTGDAWDADGNPVPQASIETAEGCLTWDDHGGEVFKPEDAEYIEAVNPTAVLALVEELERLRLEVASGEMMLRQYADRHPNDLLSKIIKGDVQ